MAGAQAAQACTEPALGDLPARGQEKKLVRFELTGLTPGSEYLVKVNGRERKSGVAATDKVSRRFRMPNMGDSNRRVLVEVVIAHDSCETSPWKLQEKMTYRPAPEPQAPQAQPAPAPTPAPAPSPVPDLSPSPPPAPDPPAAPSITDSKPAPQPAVPTPAPNPAAPAVPVPGATEPPRDGKAWITPLDPYQRAENAPPKLRQGALARAEQPSEVANSTAALVGLAGIFLLFSGVGAIGWNRFRRYDNERLEEVENPEGKLPTHLDPKAKDMTEEVAKKKRRLLPWRKPSVPSTAVPVAAGAAAAAAAAGDGAGKTTAEPRTGGRGVLADLTDEEKAKLSPEEIERLKQERIFERRKAAKKRKKAVLPTFDPTAPGAEAAAAAAAAAAGAGKPERKDDEPAKKKRLRGLLRRNPAPSAPDPPAPAAAQPPNDKPSPAAVPPIPAPPVNGAPHVNGAPAAPVTPPAKPTGAPAQPPNGQPAAPRSYREQVESELQRILNDAGLHAEVDGILADAKQEAQRQGVPIDSELMLKALCDETNGAAKLSDSARGELESRFKRIVAEERGERGPTPGS